MKTNLVVFLVVVSFLGAATLALAALPDSQPTALQTYRCLNGKMLLLTDNGRSVRIALAGREHILLWQTANRASNASFEWRLRGAGADFSRVSSGLPLVRQCRLLAQRF